MIRSEELLMLNYLNSLQIKFQFITLFTSRCQSDNEETHQGQPESKDYLAVRESKQRNPNDLKDYMWTARLLSSLVTGGRVDFRSRACSLRPLTKSCQSYSWFCWWFNPTTLSFTSCMRHYNDTKGKTCKTRSLLSEPDQLNECFRSSIPDFIETLFAGHLEAVPQNIR